MNERNCMPPDDEAWRTWHWLQLDEAEGPMPLRWNGPRGVWQFGTEDVGTPAALATEGWRYIGACVPPQGKR